LQYGTVAVTINFEASPFIERCRPSKITRTLNESTLTVSTMASSISSAFFKCPRRKSKAISVWLLGGSLAFLLLQIGALHRSTFGEILSSSAAQGPPHDNNDEDQSSGYTYAERIWVQLTVSLEYELDLIPHAIDHYINKIGADPRFFLLALHHTDSNETDLFEAAETRYRKEFGLLHFYRWSGNYDSNRLWETRQDHRAIVNIQPCDWIVRSDADEFLQIPGNDLREFLINVVETQGYDVVFGQLSDRVAHYGALANISSSAQSLSEQFPLSCNLTEAIAEGDTLKVVAFRGYHKENRGGHHLLETTRQAFEFRKETGLDHCGYPPVIHIDHYKWTSRVFQKILARYERYKELQMGHYVQSKRLIDHIKHHGGKIGVDELNCTTTMHPENSGGTISPNFETLYADGLNCRSLNQTCPPIKHQKSEIRNDVHKTKY
jgi:hypothetical protein